MNVFFILNNLTKCSAETSELKHGNPDWKWLLGKIEHSQDTRLSHFCVRNAIQRNKQTEWNFLAIIHKKRKSDRIIKSDSRVQDLDTILAIQKNKPITNNDPEPVVESNRKTYSVKRNLIRQDAFQNPISFFYNHFIKIQASPQLFLTYVCFPLYWKELFQEDKKSFDTVLISIFVKLRVLLILILDLTWFWTKSALRWN